MSNPRRLTADKIDAAIAMASELQQPEIIEKLLADETTQAYLESNPDKRKALRTTYQQILDQIADNLMAISRRVFVELEELINIKTGAEGPVSHKLVGNYFNYLSDTVQKEILDAATDNERTIAMERYISLAKKAFERNDFTTLNAIMAGLQSNAIYRLKANWESLSDNAKAMHASLKQFLPAGHDAQIFFMENTNASRPLIPYYGAYLSRLEFGKGRNPHDVVETNIKLAALQKQNLQAMDRDVNSVKSRYSYDKSVSVSRLSEEDLYQQSRRLYTPKKDGDKSAVTPKSSAVLHAGLNSFVVTERLQINKAMQSHIDLLRQIDKLANYKEGYANAKDQLGKLRRETAQELIDLLNIIKTPRAINEKSLSEAIAKLDALLEEKAPQLGRHRHANILKKKMNQDTTLVAMIKETRELLLDAKKEYSEEKNYQDKLAILKGVVADYKENLQAYQKLAKLGGQLSEQQKADKKNLQELLRAAHGFVVRELTIMDFVNDKSVAARDYHSAIVAFQASISDDKKKTAADPQFDFLKENNYLPKKVAPPVPSRLGRGELSIPSQKEEPEAYNEWFNKQILAMRAERAKQQATAKDEPKQTEPTSGWTKGVAHRDGSNRKKRAGEHRIGFTPEQTAEARAKLQSKAEQDAAFTREVEAWRAEVKTQRQQTNQDKVEMNKTPENRKPKQVSELVAKYESKISQHHETLFGKESVDAKQTQQERQKANPNSPHHRSRRPTK